MISERLRFGRQAAAQHSTISIRCFGRVIDKWTVFELYFCGCPRRLGVIIEDHPISSTLRRSPWLPSNVAYLWLKLRLIQSEHAAVLPLSRIRQRHRRLSLCRFADHQSIPCRGYPQNSSENSRGLHSRAGMGNSGVSVDGSLKATPFPPRVGVAARFVNCFPNRDPDFSRGLIVAALQ